MQLIISTFFVVSEFLSFTDFSIKFLFVIEVAFLQGRQGGPEMAKGSTKALPGPEWGKGCLQQRVIKVKASHTLNG